jgi:predicted DNA-binding transcriptional regulator AlpA
LLFTAAQAARLCGVSPRTWYTWDAAGKIPQAIHIGRSAFWRPETLRDWVAAGCPDRETWEAMQ